MFGLVLVSDGQNEGPLNNGYDIYCSAWSPLLWDNLGFTCPHAQDVDLRHDCTATVLHCSAVSNRDLWRACLFRCTPLRVVSTCQASGQGAETQKCMHKVLSLRWTSCTVHDGTKSLQAKGTYTLMTQPWKSVC